MAYASLQPALAVSQARGQAGHHTALHEAWEAPLSDRIRPGVLVQVVEHSNGSITAYLEYYMGIDGVTLARTGQVPLLPEPHLPGSKEWVKAMLNQVIGKM